MFKRLLVICAILILLTPLVVQADFRAWDKERINVFWAPDVGSASNLISELEFTMRFESPSTSSGYMETELYLSRDCSGCDPGYTVVLEPGLELGAGLGTDFNIFLAVIEGPNPWPYLDTWLALRVDVGWWRRHHQFRWWVKKDNNSNTFQYKVWDCDNNQELLFSDTVHLQENDYTGRIALINATAEWSGPYMDYYHVWEGHWVKEAYPSGDAYRWDRAPWWTDGLVDEWHYEADRLRVGPVLHRYDDHPRACTGMIYWPTALSGEASDEEPLFKSEVVGADDFRSGTLSSAEVQEILSAQDNKPKPAIQIQPRAVEYAKRTYLAHVLDELEGQAHWNRVDTWHINYY